jgi:hypothetical protein
MADRHTKDKSSAPRASEYEGFDELGWELDELDPELVELAERRSQGSILRPILMIVVLVMGTSIISDWRNELAYFFSPSEPVAIGSVTEFPAQIARDPQWRPPLVDNRYVSMSGVPTRRSMGRKHQYFRLVGGEIYVEVPRDDYIANPLERELAGQPKGDTDRTYFEGQGRLIAFSSMSHRYGGLRSYYNERYNVHFCDDLSEARLDEMARLRRETIRQNLILEYESASDEERTRLGLEATPSAETIERFFNSEPLCVHAYLLQTGTRPIDHWWYVAVSALIALFMAYNVVNLFRWIRGWFR